MTSDVLDIWTRCKIREGRRLAAADNTSVELALLRMQHQCAAEFAILFPSETVSGGLLRIVKAFDALPDGERAPMPEAAPEPDALRWAWSVAKSMDGGIDAAALADGERRFPNADGAGLVFGFVVDARRGAR